MRRPCGSKLAEDYPSGSKKVAPSALEDRWSLAHACPFRPMTVQLRWVADIVSGSNDVQPLSR